MSSNFSAAAHELVPAPHGHAAGHRSCHHSVDCAQTGGHLQADAARATETGDAADLVGDRCPAADAHVAQLQRVLNGPPPSAATPIWVCRALYAPEYPAELLDALRLVVLQSPPTPAGARLSAAAVA